MNNKVITPKTDKDADQIEASFEDTGSGLDQPIPGEVTAEATWPHKQILVQNSNHQYQHVSQDNTTINNLFRSETKGPKDFLFKIFIELVLSLIEPDRFLKNAKAILFLVIAYIFLKMDFTQIKELFELYLSHSK